MFLLKRLAHYLFVLWLTVTMLFTTLVLIKGNPVSLYVDPRLSQESREHLMQVYGYDQPAFRQYLTYLGNLCRGEAGLSFTHKKDVTAVLAPRIFKSFVLCLCALTLACIFSVFHLLLLHRVNQYWLRNVAELFLSVLITVPAFLFASAFIAFLGVRLGWFPIYGSSDLFNTPQGFWANVKSSVHHGFLPVLSLALPLSGTLTAYLHEQLLLLEDAPFVMAARGRGVSESRIFFNHKLRSLLPSYIQLLGLYLPMVAGGAMIIETMFGWAGLGIAMMDAVLSRDYPLLLAGSIWTALWVIPAYEIADYFRSKLNEAAL